METMNTTLQQIEIITLIAGLNKDLTKLDIDRAAMPIDFRAPYDEAIERVNTLLDRAGALLTEGKELEKV